METQFYITLTLRTLSGLESFGKFFIGNDRDRAYNIFRQLKGLHEINEDHILFMDFFETREGLPVNLDIISCTLNQLAENCRILTKELFKSENLENE